MHTIMVKLQHFHDKEDLYFFLLKLFVIGFGWYNFRWLGIDFWRSNQIWTRRIYSGVWCVIPSTTLRILWVFFDFNRKYLIEESFFFKLIVHSENQKIIPLKKMDNGKMMMHSFSSYLMNGKSFMAIVSPFYSKLCGGLRLFAKIIIKWSSSKMNFCETNRVVMK